MCRVRLGDLFVVINDSSKVLHSSKVHQGLGGEPYFRGIIVGTGKTTPGIHAQHLVLHLTYLRHVMSRLLKSTACFLVGSILIGLIFRT